MLTCELLGLLEKKEKVTENHFSCFLHRTHSTVEDAEVDVCERPDQRCCSVAGTQGEATLLCVNCFIEGHTF